MVMSTENHYDRNTYARPALPLSKVCNVARQCRVAQEKEAAAPGSRKKLL